MIPEKPSNQTQFDLFRLQLDNIINRNHELYRLAKMIDRCSTKASEPCIARIRGAPANPLA